MNMRTNRETAPFTQPLNPSGVAGELPPGPYDLDTDAQSIDDLSFVVWHRVAASRG